MQKEKKLTEFSILCFILIDSIIFVKNENTQKLLIFKKWIYLQVYGLFTLERFGLSLVSAENLFMNIVVGKRNY